jgi:hypothetical protein
VFANFLCGLDDAFQKNDTAIKWLGREVVLAGLFAAIGKYSSEQQKPKTETLIDFSINLSKFCSWLNLDSFEVARNTLNLAKVNIGNKNKIAVQNATLQFLSNPDADVPDWTRLFDGGLLL